MREGVWQCAGWMETVFEYSRNHNRSVCRVAIHISGDDSFFDWMDDGSMDVSACMCAGTKVQNQKDYLGRAFYVCCRCFDCVSSI